MYQYINFPILFAIIHKVGIVRTARSPANSAGLFCVPFPGTSICRRESPSPMRKLCTALDAIRGLPSFR